MKGLRFHILIMLIICCLYHTDSYGKTLQPDEQLRDTVSPKESYWQKLFRGNVDRTFEKKIDFVYALTPMFSAEEGIGLYLMGTGLYRLDSADSLQPPSDISATASASLKNAYKFIVKGNTSLADKKTHILFDLSLSSNPLNLWGVNYEACAVNPAINYTRQQIKSDIVALYSVAPNTFVGTSLTLNISKATKVKDISYFERQPLSCGNVGVGVSMQYDNRDIPTNPSKGVKVQLRATVMPNFMSNHNKTVFRYTLNADFYQKIWPGAVMALDLYAQLNSKNAPWNLREELGGAYRMRGYYAGRYIDNNIMSCQIEIRQSIAYRFGCVAWVGCGTVFPSFNKLNNTRILPTYGVGVRWELKKNINIRVDYGFGYKSGTLVFSIGEAF